MFVLPSLADMAAGKKPTRGKPSRSNDNGKSEKPRTDSKTPPAANLNVVRSKVISFACPVCQTMMRASEEELGHVIMCPQCFSPVTVGGEKHKKPAPAAEPRSLVLEDTGDDEYQLADDEFERPKATFPTAEPLAPSDASSLNRLSDDEYRLTHAEERPRVSDAFAAPSAKRRSSTGASPKSSKRPPRSERTESRSASEIEDPWSVPEPKPRPSLEERLAAALPDWNTPRELPDHPFVTGIFGFLLYASTRIRWLGLAAGLAIVYFLAANAIARGIEGGPALFQSLIFGVMAGAGLLVVGMLGSVTSLAIVNDTAAGNEEVLSWPDYVFLDWAGQAFYVFNAVAFAALPGFLVASFIDASGPERWAITAACAGLSGVLLFPVILLSQLDGSSPFSVLTAGVLKSIPAAFSAWIACYAMIALVVGVAVVGSAAAVWIFGPESIVAALVIGILGSAALLLSSRLIGRLAWYVEEEEVVIETSSTTESEDGSEEELSL